MKHQDTINTHLWQQLQIHNLVNGEMPDIESFSPWTIRLMQGFAGWVAAIFLLLFVVSIFSWLFRNDNELIVLSLGLAACSIAYLLFRSKQSSDFFNQLALVISLSGQVMVIISLVQWFSYESAWVYLLAGAFQLALAVILPNFIHRAMSSWFAMILTFWGFNLLGIYGLGVSIAALLLTLILSNEHRWGKHLPLWEPISYGLALSLVQFNGHMLFREDLWGLFEKSSTGWFFQMAPWVSTIVVAATFLYLIIKLLKQYEITLTSRVGLMGLTGGALLVLTGLPITGMSSAILILVLGFMTHRRVLLSLGGIALLSFVSWYYYNLDTTLLVKSFIFIGVGVLLILVRYAVHVFLSGQKKISSENIQKCFFSMNAPKWIALLVFVMSISMVNLSIYQKEQVLENGKMVLLELAPVDPRSLMQGDYMRLRFRVERDAFSGRIDQYDRDGYLVVNIDENSVGHFDRFYEEGTLSANQVKMQYRIRKRHVQFATNAFFFQEGQAKLFERARYGEFRVDDSGTLLLSAMRDEQYNVLGKNKL